MDNIDKLCMGCMNIKKNDICEICGYNGDNKPYALRLRTILDNRYIVGAQKSKNANSIEYIGFDKVLCCRVYIIEFFPKNLCMRDRNSNNIILRKIDKDCYYNNLNVFLNRFRDVARFRDLSSIGPIYNIFSENNTGYAICEYIEGDSLSSFVYKQGGHISWDIAKQIFMPILSGLDKMHSAGVLHLGICPDNIIVKRRSDDNELSSNEKIEFSAVLIGPSLTIVRDKNQNSDSGLHSGFSALEQYTNALSIDKSTDVYGFCATLLYALCGKSPASALKRQDDDKLLISKNMIKIIPKNVISAIAGGLKVLPENRTSDFSTLRNQLSDSANFLMESITEELHLNEKPKEEDENDKEDQESKKKNVYWLWVSIIVTFILVGAFVTWVLLNNVKPSNNEPTTDDSAQNQKVETNVKQDKKVVPHLIGQNFESAKNTCSKNGIKLLLSGEEFSETIPEGCIMSQNPQEGTSTDSISNIVVVVSKGSKMKTLPEIQGDSISTACNKLTKLSLIPQKKEKPSNTVEENLVIGYESNSPGDKIEYGSNIVILISTGKLSKDRVD